MKKYFVLSFVLLTSAVQAKNQECMYCDVFKTMRECDQGRQVAKELDELRERLSKKIEEEAKKLAENEKEFKAKASTMKRDAAEKEERKLAKKRRELEDLVRDGEEELKMSMNQKTEALAIEVEKNIAEIAKARGFERVVDVTGRTVYCKDGSSDDITSDAISYLNEKAQGKTVTTA